MRLEFSIIKTEKMLTCGFRLTDRPMDTALTFKSTTIESKLT